MSEGDIVLAIEVAGEGKKYFKVNGVDNRTEAMKKFRQFATEGKINNIDDEDDINEIHESEVK